MASSWSKLLLASTFWLRKKICSNDGALSEITDSFAIARLIADTTHDHQDLDLWLAYDAWKQGGSSWWKNPMAASVEKSSPTLIKSKTIRGKTSSNHIASLLSVSTAIFRYLKWSWKEFTAGTWEFSPMEKQHKIIPVRLRFLTS